MQTLLCPMLFILSIACSSGSNQAEDTKQPIDLVLAKKELYESLYSRVADDSGFIHRSNCDGLLYNGLYCAGSTRPDILPFRDETTGQWYRTPEHTCYAEGRSGSTISRDMLAGAMWCLFRNKDEKALERLRQYGLDHDWIMGEGSKDRTYFTPNFQDTLYRLVGKDYKGPAYLWVDPRKDHQRHIVALNIILRGERDGEINDQMLSLLEAFYAENPNNALFSYGVARFTDGNQSETINILLNNTWFPPDRLPTGYDRCGLWLWERADSHANWKPCPEKTTHSGGDLIFVAALLERSKAK